MPFSDYLLLCLLTKEETDACDNNNEDESENEFIEVNDKATGKVYWIIKNGRKIMGL